MSIIVIGGHSRNVGKTSVMAEIISALPQCNWTALKITQYGHGICSANGHTCDCESPDHAWAITEEKDRSGKSDTSRFLLAGAQSSLWIRTRQGRLGEAVPALLRKIAGKENVICESNSLMEFLQPDIYLSVLQPGTPDFKASARRYLHLADALILHRPTSEKAPWTDVLLPSIAGKRTFQVLPPPYVTPEIIAFVRERLAMPLARS